MKKQYFLLLICLLFIDCSKKEELETIQNLKDSILYIKTKQLDTQTEVAELKKVNIELNEENQNLKKELIDIKKTIEIDNEGPSKEFILKSLDNYFNTHGALFIGTKRETYTASIIGKSESRSSDIYISQCRGKIKFSGKGLAGEGLFNSFDFQAEVIFKKFGGEWQLEDVNLKRSNSVNSK